MENRWLVQHYMLLWMTGSPSQLTLHFWEAKTINILRKVTCESMQLPYYTEAIPLICKGWGVFLFAILFCITETCYSKRDAYIPIPCTKKTIQLLFKHLIYIFLVTSSQWWSALVIRPFFPFWVKIFLLIADFKCILCNSIN